MKIDISKLDKAEVLMVLYNNSRPLGMGYIHYDSNKMTIEEAREHLKMRQHNYYFDYLKGRVMKVDLEGDCLNTTSYDHDNGFNAALKALQPLLERIK